MKFFANLIGRGLYSFFQVKGKEVRIMLIEDFSDEMIEFGVKEQMQDMYLYLREDKGVIQFRKNQEIASFKVSVG